MRLPSSVMAGLLLAGCASTPEVPAEYVERCEPRLKPEPICIRQAVPLARTLLPGERVRASVDARCKWNRTGVLLEPQVRYQVTVGEPRDWRDKGVRSDLETGWVGPVASVIERFARPFARDGGSPMYSLVGERGKGTGDYVLIGKGRVIEGSGQGAVELQLFANDWRGMYRNNEGCVEVEIGRGR